MQVRSKLLLVLTGRGRAVGQVTDPASSISVQPDALTAFGVDGGACACGSGISLKRGDSP
jgi:hypothetical protein